MQQIIKAGNEIERNICTFAPDKIVIVDHENNDLADLEMETRPEVALVEIHRLQATEIKKS